MKENVFSKTLTMIYLILINIGISDSLAQDTDCRPKIGVFGGNPSKIDLLNDLGVEVNRIIIKDSEVRELTENDQTKQQMIEESPLPSKSFPRCSHGET